MLRATGFRTVQQRPYRKTHGTVAPWLGFLTIFAYPPAPIRAM